jgi:hypothetical protein
VTKKKKPTDTLGRLVNIEGKKSSSAPVKQSLDNRKAHSLGKNIKQDKPYIAVDRIAPSRMVGKSDLSKLFTNLGRWKRRTREARNQG